MLLGMCIVDMHHLYRKLRNKKCNEIHILEFSDMLCKKLTVWSRRQNERLSRSNIENHGILERITDKNSNNRFTLTDKQETRGRIVGWSIHQNCFICQKYLALMRETEYIQTTFRCSACKMPLCKEDWSKPEIGRNQSCVDEHNSLRCETVGCNGYDCHYTNFPKDLQVQLVSRQITKNMNYPIT